MRCLAVHKPLCAVLVSKAIVALHAVHKTLCAASNFCKANVAVWF